jgi:hypothetical protein
MFRKALKGIFFSSLVLLPSFVFQPLAIAQASVCPSVNKNISIQSKVSSFMGDAIDLSQFSGIQVLILASIGSMNTAQETSKMIDLEFQYSKKFRQVILLDAKGMGGMRNMMSEHMKDSASYQPSKNTSMSIDFDGNMIRPLIEASEKLFPNTKLYEEPVLLILDGKGRVLSAYNKIGSDLQIRQCLREQLKLERYSNPK